MPENLTEEEKEKLKEMLDTWEAAHRTIRFLSGTGRALKWLLGLLAPVAIIWSALHGGSPK